MNTKTMRLPPRRVLTPTNKRKERDDPFDRPKPIPAPPTTKILKPDKSVDPPKPSNQLLAGYLAHEFLTKGTLLGQPWVPQKGKSTERTEEERERYAEVASLLKGGGTQLPGVVNPTQLARFLHL
ncbi:hypothetical protein V8G54_029758 [Vigna mungo]|uniref:Uncharacterized protein n=1 Tax=Vigna mungo TaxID=3915 RepID=A0AAQ3MUE1_VIGMU